MHKPSALVLAATVCLTIAATALRVAPAAQQSAAAAAPQTARLGEFTLDYRGGTIDFGSRGSAGYEAVLTSPRRVRVTSTRMDMSARRITLTARAATKKTPLTVTDVDATGGVHFVLRQPESNRTTVIDCDRASYNASATPGQPRRIDVVGNVRTEMRDPAFVQPFVNRAERGVITLLPGGEIRVNLSDGSASGQAREPAPKPQKKDAP